MDFELGCSIFIVHSFYKFLRGCGVNIFTGAGVRRHLPVGKDGPCAGTKGYRAPEVRTLFSSQKFNTI